MPEVLQQMLNYVIAIYIRLSAEDGDLSDEKSESNSVVNQRAYIRRFIELRPEFAGAQILEFCDDGYSGTNMERPAVRRLLEQVRQRKINCIIVKDMSRFGRDYIVVGDYLEQIFPFLDVRFIAINDSYDSKDHKYGSAGLIDVSFRNVIYDLYSKDLSEKVRSPKKATVLPPMRSLAIRKRLGISTLFWWTRMPPPWSGVCLTSLPAACLLRT